MFLVISSIDVRCEGGLNAYGSIHTIPVGMVCLDQSFFLREDFAVSLNLVLSR
jgi:hypothetical protein